ncbi:MAG TPA: histidine kinase, partial [Saprospiraceae bacterium]|nr:histidine kinase [Saprospiraceae bacterium]
PPFRQAEFDILFERGINREGCLLDLAATEGVIERSGAWYAYQGNRIGQGRDNACQYLRENQETAQEIETELRRRQEESRKQGLNKPGAAEALKVLRKMGVSLKIITGDNLQVARHVAASVGLAVEGRGKLVIGYEDGFEVLDPSRPDHFVFFDPANGAPLAEMNLNAMSRDAQGNVWMGTRQGVVRVATFGEPFLDDPQPALTAVSVFMQPIDFQRQQTFAHDQNYFLFQFKGLWYTQPDAVNYRYRLESFDPAWRVSKDNQASYSKLPPGRYIFRLQASEHGNFEEVPEISWAFEIEAPIWMKWWFYVLLAAPLAAALWALVKNREARLNREALLKREAVEAQFAALKSQINPHFLFNSFNTLITIIEENPPMAVEYVEHLSDFYRMIMAYRERDFITVHEELTLVRSFDFLLKRRYERGFQLLNRIEPTQPGQLMPLTLQMLVENAVKHNIISEDKPLVVEIFAEGDGYVTVRNNIRRKMKPEPSTHFGLQSLIRRHQLLGDKPVLVEDNAAFFTVKVPLN